MNNGKLFLLVAILALLGGRATAGEPANPCPLAFTYDGHFMRH